MILYIRKLFVYKINNIIMITIYNEIKGKNFYKYEKSNERIDFYCSDGYTYSLYHQQDCCENVTIDNIEGDINDLMDSPILQAEESSNRDVSGSYESATWTFYKFATSKGYVTIRWIGVSNGYYSESVSFVKSDECNLSELRINQIKKIDSKI